MISCQISLSAASDKSFVTEYPPRNSRYHNRYDDGDEESELVVFHTVYEVHSKEAGDERGEHQDDADRGERTHHGVHIVVDDARVGVHR